MYRTCKCMRPDWTFFLFHKATNQIEAMQRCIKLSRVNFPIFYCIQWFSCSEYPFCFFVSISVTKQHVSGGWSVGSDPAATSIG